MDRPFVGRREEVRLLRERLRQRTPTLSVVRGTPGIGVTRFLREVLGGRPHLHLPIPLLPEGDLRDALATALHAAGARAPRPSSRTASAGPDWGGLLDSASSLAPAPAQLDSAPFTLVLDDAHRLRSLRSGLPGELAGFMRDLRARPLPFHLVVAGTDPGGLSAFTEAEPATGAGAMDLELGPLSPGEVAPLLDRWSPMERLTAWSILGGNPRRLTTIPPRATLASAVRDLVLDPEGPFHREVPQQLERSFQAPYRYAAVLRGVAVGARSWGEIAASIPELEGSQRLGPYVKGLEERGFLEVQASLDARPGSRARTYDLPDPFLHFWFRVVLPHRRELVTVGPARVWDEEVRPGLSQQVAGTLPLAARAWLRSDAAPVLGEVAREVGALWGRDHRVDVAGILRNGAAAYGSCRWQEGPLDEGELDALDRQLRATRYGFARETRHRILFGRGAMTAALRSRVARDPSVHVVGIRELTGGEGRVL